MGKTPLRPYGGVVRTSVYSPRNRFEEMLPLVSARINGGMHTAIDSTDIEVAELARAKNVRVRFDKTSRRSGTEAYGATKPNSNAVLALYSFKDSTGLSTILRFTPTTLHKNPNSWTAITGTLTGSSSNRFSIASAFDKVVFANGVDEIQTIDLAGNTFADLGNAPKYKFVTAFANRIVGAYKTTSGSEDPIEIGWSANGLITEWDPLTDQSAGYASVIESPGDLSDFVTGVYGFTNVMIVPRERSIWLATKTGISRQPFNFVAAVPGIGFGCPYATAVVPGGLLGVDHRTEKVYLYSAGQQPIAISTKVENEIFRSLSDPEAVFGSYDNRNNEYALAIPVAGSSMVKVWAYNLRTQAWSYDERESLTTIADIEGAAQGLTIDSLSGTIDALSGTIDSLVIPTAAYTSRLYGFSDGDCELEKSDSFTDNGTSFESEIISKTFALPVTDQYVTRVRYEVICRTLTTFSLYYSLDDGLTWTLARTDEVDVINTPRLIIWNRQTKCRKFTFKIVSSNGDWDLIDYEIHVVRSGPSQATASGLV